MRLLVLGGTRFLGRMVARQAVAAGHQVTCAARGTSGEPVSGVRFVRLDRDDPDGLEPLRRESYDAVVDVARQPSHVRRAVAALADRVPHWCFVSTISVYADDATPHQRAATAPVLPPAPPEIDAPGPGHQWYGELKVAAERALIEGVGADRAFICRAGLIVGVEDPSDRFPYWVERLSRGGEVLAPGRPDEPVQFVDVADLADWLVLAAGTGLAGVHDGVGPALSRDRFLAGVAAGVGRPAPHLTWVEQDFLTAHDVREWSGERSLPLWVRLPENAGVMTRDATGALAAGLSVRPVAETAAATARWLADHPATVRTGGLTAAEETIVLRKWHSRSIR